MNLQPMWKATVTALGDCPAARAAAQMTLDAVRGDTLHLSWKKPVTQAAADKVATAMTRTLGRQVAVVVRHAPYGECVRSFRDGKGNIHGR